MRSQTGDLIPNINCQKLNPKGIGALMERLTIQLNNRTMPLLAEDCSLQTYQSTVIPHDN